MMLKNSLSLCMLLCLSIFYFFAVLLQVDLAQASRLSDITSYSSGGFERVGARKSRILIIGATGNFGRYVVEASVKARHYTVGLVRTKPAENDTSSDKAQLITKFLSWGVKIVYGDFNVDQKMLVNAMKRVDVVISCVAGTEVPTQVNITSAILKAGNIKRFFPSEYAIDVDRLQDPIEPAKGMFAGKVAIRRLVESLGIPHTYVVANGFAARFWPNLGQVNPTTLLPNIEEVIAYGDGTSKATATKEEDVATYVIKTVDDPKTLNKILYLRPPANALSFNDLFSLWEKTSGKTLKRTYVSEEEMLEMINDPTNKSGPLLSICYSVSIKNDYASYEIDPSFGVEASKRYPEVKYMKVATYFKQVLANASLPLASI